MIVRGVVLLALLLGGLVASPAHGAPTAPSAVAARGISAVSAAPAAARPRAKLTATSVTLTSGKVRVSVTSRSKRVKLTFRSAKDKKRTAIVKVRRGEGARTLPRGSRAIQARALATKKLRASRRIQVPHQVPQQASPPAASQPIVAPPAVTTPVVSPQLPLTGSSTGLRVMCRVSSSSLREISGMVSSVRHPGIVWVHNDSGDSARIFAMDVNTCAVRATVRLSGITAQDFEGMSMGRTASGAPEIWVGDIGDNARARSSIVLHRFPEPASLTDQAVAVSSVRVTWSDGARDCESLMVEPVPNGRVFLVAKDSAGGVYRLQGDFRATGAATTGSRLFTTRSAASDAAISPDGTRTVIRFYNSAMLLTGVPGTSPRTISLPSQPQGEAITFTPDGTHVYIASEGTADLVRVPVSGR